MPRRNDIHKVMIIGSGPIVIGQACEFDYSGTQACKALRGVGYEIVLVNSNPATIMTDPGMADITYIEPLNLKSMVQIIEKERPDALLPNLGGQSGLNLCSELARAGALEKYGVKVIGVQVDAIERGEDRIAFKETMNSLGIEMPRSAPALSVEEAERIAAELGYPVVIRPAYTMGGTGGGLVYNVEELRVVASRGISASLIGQILVEESVLGWEELELEVVRDAKNQMITVCFIENVDAMGVHTGDSYCTAPMLTISPELQADLQEKSYRIVEAIQVIGGTNIQFAHDPATGRVVVIEINPRTSRSSALASKATGFPIALVSSKLAAGLTMDEIPYWRLGTLEKYTPWGDYVVVKFARWAFEKFRGSEDKLGTQMRAVGEVMSIGKTYKEAFQKSIRSLENGRYGLGFAKDFHKKSLPELMDMLNQPSSERQFIMYEALRKGATTRQLYEKTYIKPYFIDQMRELVELEQEILKHRGRPLPDDLLVRAKKDGFADRYLAGLLGIKEAFIREQRTRLGVVEAWAAVPVSGVENAAYYYSTYNAPDETVASANPKKVMVLGGGPNRIGQGIEFDYCCVHAAFALRDEGYESIMVNCNPETVSTDYDTCDKLYFEPLTVEDVLSIYEKEKPVGVIVQFGGQTPLNIAAELASCGVKILGTSVETIDLAEDRDRFRKEDGEAEHPDARIGHGGERRAGCRDRGPHRVPADGPAQLRAGRPRHGGGVRRADAAPLHGRRRGRDARAADPDRQVPGQRHRGRSGRDFRRRGRLHPGRDGAHRAGGHSLGRLRLRDPAGQHPGQAHRHHLRVHPAHRGGTEGGRADEHAVRHRQRHGLRAGGQSASLADRAAGFQGLQHPDGARGHAADARQEAGGYRPAVAGRSRTTASRKRSFRSTCSRRSIRCWGRRCARPARCWAWRTRSGKPSSRRRRQPSRRCRWRGRC